MPVSVEFEKDLSLKQQRLDVVIIRKEAAPLTRRLPDGFEDLAAHNLVTFKSYQEALDGWALNELVGHYVNYRKQISPTMDDLLPETDFRLFAVCVRFPQVLAKQTTLTPVRPGVYEASHFTGTIRIVVVHELPEQEHNALLHLFSARTDLLQYGTQHYRQQSKETSTLLVELLLYHAEVANMPNALEELKQLRKETVERLLRELPVSEMLAALSPATQAELIEAIHLPVKERIKGVPPSELLAALSLEDRAALARQLKSDEGPSTMGFSPREFLTTLSPEDRAALARLLTGYDGPANGGGADSGK